MEETRQVILGLLIHFIELGKEIRAARKDGPITFEHRQQLRRIRLILTTVDVYALDPAVKPYFEELLALYKELAPQPSPL